MRHCFKTTAFPFFESKSTSFQSPHAARICTQVSRLGSTTSIQRLLSTRSRPGCLSVRSSSKIRHCLIARRHQYPVYHKGRTFLSVWPESVSVPHPNQLDSCAPGSSLSRIGIEETKKADIWMLPDAGIAGPVASANAASATPTGVSKTIWC